MYKVYYTDWNGQRHLIGEVIANHGMTPDEVYDFAGVKLARTADDFAMAEDPLESLIYDLEELEIEYV